MDTIKPLELEMISTNGEPHYIFRGTNFIFKQFDIALKYEKESVLVQDIGLKEFVRKYDLYILQTVEEIVEVMEEFYRHGEPNLHVIEELVDVIMYIGSASLFYAKNLIFMLQEFSFDFSFSVKSLEKLETPELMKRAKDNLFKCVYNLVQQRQHFEHRKWHKDIKEEYPKEKLKRIFIDMHEKSIETIQIALTLMLTFMEQYNMTHEEQITLEDINQLMLNKQNKIFGLKEGIIKNEKLSN